MKSAMIILLSPKRLTWPDSRHTNITKESRYLPALWIFTTRRRGRPVWLHFNDVFNSFDEECEVSPLSREAIIELDSYTRSILYFQSWFLPPGSILRVFVIILFLLLLACVFSFKIILCIYLSPSDIKSTGFYVSDHVMPGYILTIRLWYLLMKSLIHLPGWRALSELYCF